MKLKIKSILYKPGYCHPTCFYFPNMDCRESDWEWDKTGTYKKRKEPKVFRCGYDGHPINWEEICPRIKGGRSEDF